MFRNSLCTSYNLIVWKNFFFAFLELKFVSGRFVHCVSGKGAVILSLYCCFDYYNYSYHHHHYNYDNYHCYYHYYHYYYHRHYYYHFFSLQVSLFSTGYFSSLVILGTYLPLNGLKNMCS